MLIVFKWVFLCRCTFSPFNSIMSTGPWKAPQKIHTEAGRTYESIRLNTSADSRRCGLFSLQPLHDMARRKESVSVLRCAQFTVQRKNCVHAKNHNTTHTSHHTPKRTEGTIICCFFLGHRRTPSGRKWMNVHMKRSNSCLLCYTVCDYNFHYSTPPLRTPYGALFFFQLFPYPCIVCDIIFYYFASLAPTQDGSSARRVCLRNNAFKMKGTSKVGKEGGR